MPYQVDGGPGRKLVIADTADHLIEFYWRRPSRVSSHFLIDGLISAASTKQVHKPARRSDRLNTERFVF